MTAQEMDLAQAHAFGEDGEIFVIDASIVREEAAQKFSELALEFGYERKDELSPTFFIDAIRKSFVFQDSEVEGGWRLAFNEKAAKGFENARRREVWWAQVN